MMSSEIDFAAKAAVDPARARSFAAEVYVVEWEVAAEPAPPVDPRRERWWRNEGVTITLET